MRVNQLDGGKTRACLGAWERKKAGHQKGEKKKKKDPLNFQKYNYIYNFRIGFVAHNVCNAQRPTS